MTMTKQIFMIILLEAVRATTYPEIYYWKEYNKYQIVQQNLSRV